MIKSAAIAGVKNIYTNWKKIWEKMEAGEYLLQDDFQYRMRQDFDKRNLGRRISCDDW